MNFNEVFRKNVTYGNLRSQKNPGPDPRSRKNFFRKTTGGRQIDSPSLFRLKEA